MWSLPVNDLFMVGRATTSKLFKLGIYSIGDLAKTDKNLIYSHLKSHGVMIWNYANGIEESTVRKSNYEFMKGIGNGTTVVFNVVDAQDAYKVLLGLTESVGMRLRAADKSAKLVAVGITDTEFVSKTHQRKLMSCTDSTIEIFEIVKELFDELWKGTPIRKLKVRVSDSHDNCFLQTTLFDNPMTDKLQKIDRAVDEIRKRFGGKAITRGCFLYTGLSPIQGGVEDDYPMSSIL